MRVYNMVSPRTGHEVANQFVIDGDGVRTFQSYASTIAVIDYNERTVKIGNDWNYSTTTGKYRNAFFKDEDFRDMADTKGMNKVMAQVKKNGFALVQNGWFDDELFKVTML